MFVYSLQKSPIGRISAPLLAAVLSLTLVAPALRAQTSELPSNPSPNPSSLSNPFFGSVTLHPATDGVIKLSLDDAVQRGLAANLGLKEAETNETNLHG